MDSDAAQLPLSDRLLAWFETNKKLALWGAVVIVAGGLIIGFLVWRKGEREIEAGEALSAASVPYSSGMVHGGGAAEAYLKVANEYSGTKSAIRAKLLAAEDYFSQGKFDQARSLFEQFRREHGDNPLAGQALLGIAACLEAQAKIPEATVAYKDMVEHRPNDSATPQAKFALANLYETQNKPEQALPLFEDIVRADPYGSLGSEAGIRAEEIKQKHPNLAPSPVTPMNMTPTMPASQPFISSNAPRPMTTSNATGLLPRPSPTAPNSAPAIRQLPPTSNAPTSAPKQ